MDIGVWEMYLFEEVREKFEKLIAADCEPELEVLIDGVYYMIIGYEGFVTFQRCGQNGSGEIPYNSLDALYSAETIDGICLVKDWERIEEMYAYDFADMDTILKIYELNKMNGERK